MVYLNKLYRLFYVYIVKFLKGSGKMQRFVSLLLSCLLILQLCACGIQDKKLFHGAGKLFENADSAAVRQDGSFSLTERDYRVIEKAALYDLRRLIQSSGKETYTREELCGLLDTIADLKNTP